MNPRFLRSIVLAISSLVSFVLTGCLQNETTITLNKDGSGTIVEETMLGVQMMAMMNQFAQPGAPDPIEEMFGEAKATARAGKMGEGVKYVRTEMIDKNGLKGARIQYAFEDINSLVLNPMAALSSLSYQAPAPAPVKEVGTIRFTHASGSLKIILPPSDFENLDLPGKDMEQTPEMEAMMMRMLADMRMTTRLVIAPGIGETNATHQDGDTITLFDVEIGKLMARRDELKQITELSKTDMPAARERFAKIDGVTIEMKEDVFVKLK